MNNISIPVKKIVVTTGGTIEAIDGVRGITNFSSGRLGLMIANKLAGHHQVFLIRGRKTPRPEVRVASHVGDHPGLVDMEVTDTESVIDALKTVHKNNPDINVVIQAMAISDYTVKAVTDAHILAKEIMKLATSGLTNNELHDSVASLLQNPPSLDETGKISSTLESPLLFLKPTPKIIQTLKKLWPETQLFGFKLLNGVSSDELLRVATESMEKSHADYVVANDLQNIKDDQHKAIILSRAGLKYQATTKEEIADVIFRLVNNDKIVNVYLV